jgi:hypothetical protein
MNIYNAINSYKNLPDKFNPKAKIDNIIYDEAERLGIKVDQLIDAFKKAYKKESVIWKRFI